MASSAKPILALASIIACVVALVTASHQAEPQNPTSPHFTERAAVRQAMDARPKDPWPRGTGHVILAPPGSREEWKSYLEPGGSFSPTVGSFGVSIWIRQLGGPIEATSDSIPLDQVRQRLVWPSRHGIPAIETETPYFKARWTRGTVGTLAGNATLDLQSPLFADKTTAIAIRSVGPAGGPIHSLQWEGGQLVVNGRWRVRTIPPTTAVRLGEEGAELWTLPLLDVQPLRQWTGDSGWGFAMLELPPAISWRVEIEDSHPMPLLGLRYETARSGLELSLPEPRFAESLDAQVAHLMMGLVGRETRPGDPTNYPLAWLRDGAYAVVALARAGQLDVARQLSYSLAENDFFGGFGPEADAPGLALWAIEEVSVQVRDHEFDEWLWPHVFRKAEFILEMLDAKQPIRKAVRGPIVPRHRNDPDLSLICDPARDGLIVGRMDWHRPLLFVNAVNYRGLLSAAALAERQDHRGEAARWRERAAQLQRAWVAAFKPPASENERTYTSGLWPTWVASPHRDAFRQGLEDRWSKLRTAEGSFRETPLWTYFEIADTHQWLFLGQPERAWKTLHYFWNGQVSPGLYTWWEGEGEENTFGLWEQVRGWVNPPHVTPHYWTAAEMLLLQLDMLAYVDESASEQTLVIGAGVSPEWVSRPMSVRGVSTRLGDVDWKWDGSTMQVTVRGMKCPVRLGPAFPTNPPMKVAVIKPAWEQH
jgi:hypothetical protein